MLTREQKQKQIKQAVEDIKKSESLLFADFSGIPIGDFDILRAALRETGAKFKIVRKRLLKIAFKEAGVDYNPSQFESQTGVIFIPGEVLSVAGNIYKIAKDLTKKSSFFKILGGFNLKDKKVIESEEFIILAKLPSREILLAQIAIAFTMPMKKLMFVLNSRKEQLEQ